MPVVWIDELKEHVGEEVILHAWIHRIRKVSGKLAFILLKDKSGIVQGVVSGKPDWLAELSNEAAVVVCGEVTATTQQVLGVELQVKELQIVAGVERELPFELNQEEISAGLEHRLDHRVLTLRHPKTQAVFTVQDEIVHAFRMFLRGERFTEIFTPKIVATGTEGGTELFELKYFETKAYLSQSPQFYKQMVMGGGLQRVYEVAAAYRAEQHNTSRHLSEFISLDLEMGFIDGLEDVLALEERMMQYICDHLREHCASELALHGAVLPKTGRIPRLRIKEIAAILKREYGKELTELDLDTEAERLICDYVLKEYGSEFVFATHYGRANRPMYTQPSPDDPDTTESFDMLFRGMEMNSGAQRVHDPRVLEESIRFKGLDPESFNEYREIFSYGTPPHGGFAIGAARMTTRFLGLDNIRDAVLFPRDRFRLSP
ncbi:MAG: aspartate--tRNA(Asn) ligase [Symbiobacteriaceae bacterium]|nr:aspartate--tRNA(Asn) ligase [Symbiobacteriaceae bacterium]